MKININDKVIFEDTYIENVLLIDKDQQIICATKCFYLQNISDLKQKNLWVII